MPKSKRRKVSLPNLERKKSEDQLAGFPFAQLPEEDLDYANFMPKIEKKLEVVIEPKLAVADKKVAEKRKAPQEVRPEPFEVSKLKIKASSSSDYVNKELAQAVFDNSAGAHCDDDKLLIGNSGWGSSVSDD